MVVFRTKSKYITSTQHLMPHLHWGSFYKTSLELYLGLLVINYPGKVNTGNCTEAVGRLCQPFNKEEN